MKLGRFKRKHCSRQLTKIFNNKAIHSKTTSIYLMFIIFLLALHPTKVTPHHLHPLRRRFRVDLRAATAASFPFIGGGVPAGEPLHEITKVLHVCLDDLRCNNVNNSYLGLRRRRLAAVMRVPVHG